MKRFVKYDDRNYWTILFFILLISTVIICIFTFSEANIFIQILEIIFVIFFAMMSYIFQKFGIKFNYKKKIISAFVPISSDRCKIKMKEIKQIEVKEIYKKRKKRFYGIYSKVEVSNGLHWEPDFIYRNGKIFNIVITKKDDTKHLIFYGMLYKARSKKRVRKQEDRINSAIKEFNEYRIKNKFFKA